MGRLTAIRKFVSKKSSYTKILFIISMGVFISYSLIESKCYANDDGLNETTKFVQLHEFLEETYGEKVIKQINHGRIPNKNYWTPTDAALLYLTVAEGDNAVKIAALKVIRKANYKYIGIIPYLIDLLADNDVELRQESYETLKKITGKDFGYNVSAWTSWWKYLPLPESMIKWIITLLPVILIFISILKIIKKTYPIKVLYYMPIPVIVSLYFYQALFRPWGLFADVFRLNDRLVYFLYYDLGEFYFCSHSDFIVAKIKFFGIFGGIIVGVIWTIYKRWKRNILHI